MDQMGSAYLLAHGLGTPVANAKSGVGFPQTGTYHVWVRTKDWVPSHQPGRFRVLIDGTALGTTFGTTGKDWAWQDGGQVVIDKKKVSIELQDLTGFDGRCDAVYFSSDERAEPPSEPDDAMADWRRRLLGLPATPPSGGTFDVVIIGGGLAGCSAAVTAARLGLDAALVQNRPVLGGNASSEIGIPPAGLARSVVDELARFDQEIQPNRRAVVEADKKIRLFLGWHAFRVQTQNSRITGVDAKNTRTGEEVRLDGPIFVDCTGDGTIGFRAGADYRMGREGREEFNESLAPEKPDKMTHGATLYFKIKLADAPVSFPEVPWAVEVSKDHLDLKSDHSWEYGHWRDMINEAEEIRDHMLRAIYGTFAKVKQEYPKKAARVELARVDYVAARGESRRLMGDHILSENDVRNQVPFADGVATGGLVFCLHYPGEKHDFRSKLELTRVEPYSIPFRCLYSRNVSNLMMAGRDASATHIGYSTIKLMRTGGQMGVAVGAAAYLCKKHKTTPRGVYENHVEELKNVVFERADYENALKSREVR